MAIEYYFPDAHAETSSVDGDISYDGGGDAPAATRQIAWDAVRDGTASTNGSTDSTSPASIESTIVNIGPGAYFGIIYRGVMTFDTSALPDTATVTAATVYIHHVLSNADDKSGDEYAHLVACTTASETAVAVGDYGSIGSTSFANVALLVGDGAVNAYTLNASGRSHIKLTAATKFMLVTGNDFNDNPIAEPAAFGQKTNSLVWTTADAAEGLNIITYDSANSFTILGDVTTSYLENTSITISGSTGGANDGTFRVNADSTFGGGVTTVVLSTSPLTDVATDGNSTPTFSPYIEVTYTLPSGIAPGQRIIVVN